MKKYLLNTGTLAEASPFDPVWVIRLRADGLEASKPGRWPGKQMLGKALSAVRDAIRTSEAGLANPVSLKYFAVRPRPTEFMRFPQRHLALSPRTVLA